MSGKVEPRPLPRAARFFFLGWLLGAMLGVVGEARADIVPGVVVVGFGGAPSAREFARGRAASLGLGTGRLVAKLGVQALTVPVGREREWAERLRREPGVTFAEPEAAFHAARLPDDPLYSAQAEFFGPRNVLDTLPGGIDIEDAWNYRTSSGDLILGVLDSGLDFQHPDLGPNIFRRPPRHPGSRDNPGDEFAADTLGWNFAADDNNPSDEFGHGTAVAGVLGAVGNNHVGIAGVLWKTQLLAVKVLDGGGNGTGTGVAAGMVYAVDAGARILNLSLASSEYSTPIFEAARYARDHGVIVVCAAGNDSRDLGKFPLYPASLSLDNVVAVGAVFKAGGELASFSNFGGPMRVAAPGRRLTTTFVGGGYHGESGTSFAAPIVTGALAMLWSHWKDWKYGQVIGALYASTRVNPGSGNEWGVLDFKAIVAQFLGDSLPPARVEDLRLVPAGHGRAAAAFTAPGEDARGGFAESYLFRWSARAITPSNFDQAEPLEVAHKPGLGGVRDSLLLSGLPFGTNVYVAMKTRDRVHNISAVSNDASVLVPFPGTLVLSADSLELPVAQGGGATVGFKIFNPGSEALQGRLLDFLYPQLSWQTVKGSTFFEIAPRDSLRVRLSVDAGDLEAGTRLVEFGRIESDDPARPRVRIRVRVTVTPPARTGGPSRARNPVNPPGGPQVAARDRFAAGVSASGPGLPQFSLGSAWFESGSLPRILDVTGREVARLARPASGEGLVTWDGVTVGGAHAASGIYFLRLDAPGRSRVLRFVRIR